MQDSDPAGGRYRFSDVRLLHHAFRRGGRTGGGAATGVRTIWNELTGIDAERSLDTCRLSVDEIREDPQAFDEYAPGSGFTWY
jgi:hypothetical protein